MVFALLGSTAFAQNPFFYPTSPTDPNYAKYMGPGYQLELNAQPALPKSGPTEGDPVSLLTGELQVNETDLSIVGRGMDFSLSRSYRSRTLRSSAMGSRWDFNWNQSVVLEYGIMQTGGQTSGQTSGSTTDGTTPVYVVAANYYDGNNRIVPFHVDLSTTEWQSPPGYFAKLRHDGVPPINTNPPTQFQLRNADGTVLTFAQRSDFDPYVGGTSYIYHITRIEDRRGNALQFQYELCTNGTQQWHRLHTVTDTFARTITFAYTNGTVDAALSSVTDCAGRSVLYNHDSHNNLIEVTTPTAAASYPAGRRTRYVYPTFVQGSTHNYDLLQVISPQEYQNGSIPNPVPYLQNTYDSGSHVISQIVGGTNASGIAAGGVHTFRYEASDPPVYRTWFTEALRTLSVDPNGNVHLSLFDSAGNEHLSYQFTGRVDPASLPQTSIDTIVQITPAAPSVTDHLSAGAWMTAPLRSSDPGCYFSQRSFNIHGMVTSESGGGSTAWGISAQTNYTYTSSADVFQQGNLLKIEQVGQGQPNITTIRIYEPVYNQLRASIDPRGVDSSYIPPNGGAQSAGRYTSLNTFDYQEDSFLANGITATANIWGIDMAQADQAALAPGVPPITSASGLGDVNLDGLGKAAGNVIVAQAPSAKVLSDPLNSGTAFGAPQTTQVVIQYNAYSLPTKITDAESNSTTFTYFPAIDPMGLSGSLSSQTGGGMQRLCQQPAGVTTERSYDSLGRCIQTVNGRGFISEGNHRFASTTVYNELDEVVQTTDALGYDTLYFYDWNGRKIEQRHRNRQPQLDAQFLPTGAEIDGDSGAWIIDYWTYDILGHQVVQDSQVDATTRKITKFRYDRNGNHVLTLSPEWGNDPKNVECVVFDERGLAWKVTCGSLSPEFRGITATQDIPERTAGVIPTNADAATTTKDYTINGQILRSTDPEGHSYQYVYDSFQRNTQATDPVGNYNVYSYDVASQRIESRNYELGGALLTDNKSAFDERGREYETNQALFAVNSTVPVQEGALTPGDGWVTSRCTFNRNDCKLQLVSDNRVSQTFAYDGLSRLILQSDTTGNSKSVSYDKCSNAIRVSVVEAPSAGGSSDTTVTNYFFDALNRQTATVDNQGLTSRVLYDSRGAVVFSSDPLNTGTLASFSTLDSYSEHPLGGPSVNNHGNTTVCKVDDAGRTVKTIRHLRVSGVGGGALTTQAGDGKITIEQSFDLNDRLTSQKDDNGNITSYSYDALNRQTHTAYADGTSEDQTYNLSGSLHTTRDANQSLVTFSYNANKCVTAKSISRGPGVGGTTSESYTYDGLNRVVTGTDDDVTVVRHYDSLSRVIEESINGVVTKAVYDSADHLYDLTYPNARFVHYRYDSADRLDRVYDDGSATNLATYKYIGKTRVSSRDYPINGRRLTVGYDQSRRVTTTVHNVIASGSGVDRRTVVWNRASSKTSRTDNLTNVGHQFTYDSAYRMLTASRTGSSANQTATFTIDGAEDWSTVTGGQLAGNYSMTGLDQPVNQYTSTPGVTRTYDDNGNLTGATGSRNAAITYDYRNQMVSYRDTVTNAQHTYAYDVFGRRTSKVVNANTSPTTIRYYYCGSRIIEERTGTGATLATYVYGNGLDEILSAKRGSTTTFFHQDDLGNVMKITGTNGAVVNSYEYGEYGRVLNATTFQPLATPAQTDNLILFTGARYDPETGFYHLRTRYLDPTAGRFTSRDTIGIWGDGLNCGNGTTYVANNPWSNVDPTGCCVAPGPPALIDITWGYIPRSLQRFDQRGLVARAMAPISTPEPPYEEGFLCGGAFGGSSSDQSGPTSGGGLWNCVSSDGYHSGSYTNYPSASAPPACVTGGFFNDDLLGHGVPLVTDVNTINRMQSEADAWASLRSNGDALLQAGQMHFMFFMTCGPGAGGGGGGEEAEDEVLGESLALRAAGAAGGVSKAETVAETASIRASQIHSTLDGIAQNHRTTAVLVTECGTVFVAGSGAKGLAQPQLSVLTSSEIAVGSAGAGAHAETAAIAAAKAMGMTPYALGASRIICPACTEAIQVAGGIVSGRFATFH